MFLELYLFSRSMVADENFDALNRRTTVEVSETNVLSLTETETATVESASTRPATEDSNSSTTFVLRWI